MLPPFQRVRPIGSATYFGGWMGGRSASLHDWSTPVGILRSYLLVCSLVIDEHNSTTKDDIPEVLEELVGVTSWERKHLSVLSFPGKQLHSSQHDDIHMMLLLELLSI